MIVSLLLFSACEFEGAAHRVRFDSDLVRPGDPWHPGFPVAAGTLAKLWPVGLVGEKDRTVDLVPSVRGPSEIRDVVDGQVGLIAEKGTSVLTFSGETTDWFEIRAKPVSEAGLASEWGRLDHDGVVTLVLDGAVPFMPDLRSRTRESLAYGPNDIGFDAEGVAVLKEGITLFGAEVGTGAVNLSFLGDDFDPVRVDVIHPDDIVAIEILVWESFQDAESARVVGRTENGTPVDGIIPEWSDGVVVFEPSLVLDGQPKNELIATWQGLTTTWERR